MRKIIAIAAAMIQFALPVFAKDKGCNSTTSTTQESNPSIRRNNHERLPNHIENRVVKKNMIHTAATDSDRTDK